MALMATLNILLKSMVLKLWVSPFALRKLTECQNSPPSSADQLESPYVRALFAARHMQKLDDYLELAFWLHVVEKFVMALSYECSLGIDLVKAIDCVLPRYYVGIGYWSLNSLFPNLK